MSSTGSTGGSAPIAEVVRAIAAELELDASGLTLRRTVELAAAELELEPSSSGLSLRAMVATLAAELGIAWP